VRGLIGITCISSFPMAPFSPKKLTDIVSFMYNPEANRLGHLLKSTLRRTRYIEINPKLFFKPLD